MKKINFSKLSFLLIVLMIGSVIMSSCKKDNDEPEVELTAKQKLTRKPWKLIVDSDVFSSGIAIDNLEYREECFLDDLLDFKSDNSYEKNEGETYCSMNDPFVFEEGSWNFSVGEDSLYISGNGEYYELLTLSTKTLKLRTVENNGEVVHFHNLTFSAQ